MTAAHAFQADLDWASGWGQDEYGLYAEFELRGVTQRMRWLPPGKFVMGSPESEAERSDSELEHEVELTGGFWLGETACTQALWWAVMGGNPSRFKGEDLPVEQVSWTASTEFCARSESLSPGLRLRLPTEAEWEYGCRAGTRTPFWFGATVTPEQVNYDGNYPYAGGPGGQCREQTVPVRSLPPNSWGLHEMHGNVWEWCGDWYGVYDSGRVTDASGPGEGTERVLRGGSWRRDARYARSAQRHALEPSYRYDFIGFRLARGRTSQGAAEPPAHR